jgi:hypothetical protein
VLPTLASYAVLSLPDRAALAAASYLACLAWSGAFLVYLAALHHLLRAREDETTALLAGVGLAGGLVNAAVIVLSVFFLALGEQAASLLANNFTGFATAVCVGGFSPALRRVGFPRWLVALGAAVGLHHLASAAAFATEGLFSPGGPISTSAPLGMTLWIGCVAALTWRRRERV